MTTVDARAFLDCYAPGGLYRSKDRAQLAPEWHVAVRNWRRARQSADGILAARGDGEAFLASWQSTGSTWALNHVLSTSADAASSALLTDGATRAHPEQETRDQAFRTWVSPHDRYTRSIVDGLADAVGRHRAAVEPLVCLNVPAELGSHRVRTCRVRGGDVMRRDDLVEIAWAARSRVFAIAEELEDDDVHLEALDETYRRVGLRRFRSIFLAYTDRPVGAVIAYRGPLGLDFRYLENRCELLIHPTLSRRTLADVATSLLRAAAPVYDELSFERIPVIADDRTAGVLEAVGARRRERCELAIVLRDGYADWCRHLARSHVRPSAG